MTSYRWIIAAVWLVFIVYWIVSAFAAKRSIGGGWDWRREIGIRLAIIVLVVLGLRLSGVRPGLWSIQGYAVARDPVMGWIGAVLSVLGVGLAVWARAHLGRNWGMPMSRKEYPELVTSGPYAFVRHPIYGGILLAILGSTIGLSIVWLVPLILGTAYIGYAARQEEKLMTAEFPDQYPAYMRRTKMLLPFLL